MGSNNGKMFVAFDITFLSEEQIQTKASNATKLVERIGYLPIFYINKELKSSNNEKYLIERIKVISSCDSILLFDSFDSPYERKALLNITEYLGKKTYVNEILLEDIPDIVSSAIFSMTKIKFSEYSKKGRKRENVNLKKLFVMEVLRLSNECYPFEKLARLVGVGRCDIYHYKKVFPGEIEYDKGFKNLLENVQKITNDFKLK